MSFKKRLFFRISHSMATLAPNYFGITQPYHEIKPLFELPNNSRVYLGSMLLDAPSGIYHRYHYKAVVEKLKLGCIVRTLEPFERETKLWGGVKAATKRQYEALGVEVVDISIKDFIAHFKAVSTTFVAELYQALQKLLQLQQAGKHLYFHCKAGKNRSFKALTTYLVYVQIETVLQNGTLNDAELKKLIKATCERIQFHRPQVIYKNARQIEAHEAFVYECIKAFQKLV